LLKLSLVLSTRNDLSFQKSNLFCLDKLKRGNSFFVQGQESYRFRILQLMAKCWHNTDPTSIKINGNLDLDYRTQHLIIQI
jgi:hypothetical protein